MPVALTIAPDPPAPPSPPRKRWTRAEIAAVEATGVWDQQELELIDGELISKMPKNRAHVVLLTRIAYWLMDVFGRDQVNQEAPIDVSADDNPTNEPEPDVIVLRRPASAFQLLQPQASDLALVVEVSDSTLQFDTTVKSRLYARAGIADYWVLDVNDRRLIVHRDPGPDGYRSVIAYSASEKVSPLASPHSELLVGDIVPA